METTTNTNPNDINITKVYIIGVDGAKHLLKYSLEELYLWDIPYFKSMAIEIDGNKCEVNLPIEFPNERDFEEMQRNYFDVRSIYNPKMEYDAVSIWDISLPTFFCCEYFSDTVFLDFCSKIIKNKYFCHDRSTLNSVDYINHISDGTLSIIRDGVLRRLAANNHLDHHELLHLIAKSLILSEYIFQTCDREKLLALLKIPNKKFRGAKLAGTIFDLLDVCKYPPSCVRLY